MRNVMTWLKATASGFKEKASEYSYQDVPLGEYQARLDFKIWSKKIMGINCYFTVVETGQKILLTGFCREEGKYIAGKIDFTSCPLDRIYKLRVSANQKKKIVLSEIYLVEEL